MDWIASGLIILGNFYLGKKSRFGWVALLISNALWIYISLLVTPHLYGMIACAIINSAIALGALRKWNKKV